MNLTTEQKIKVLDEIGFNFNNQDTNNWDQPIPFKSAKPPKFPIHCLPGNVGEYVIAVSKSTETPVEMAAVASLVVASRVFAR